MQISIKDVHEREDPYQLFLDSIKNSETKRKYKNILYRFLKLIPNQFYEDSIGHSPKDTKIETLATSFVYLTKNDPKLAQNIIATFIKEEKKTVGKNCIHLFCMVGNCLDDVKRSQCQVFFPVHTIQRERVPAVFEVKPARLAGCYDGDLMTSLL